MSDKTVDETPWEVSVLVALLNMLWAHTSKKSAISTDVVHAFDGNAETALGDILLGDEDRLFLFELKASWRRAQTEAAKPIYTLYESHYSAAQTKLGGTDFLKLIHFSMRCHHLAYWEDIFREDGGPAHGSISFSPYAQFVMDELSLLKKPAIDFRFLQSMAVCGQHDSKVVEAAKIEQLFDRSAKAVSGDLRTGQGVSFYELGLDKDDFLTFVNLLRGDNGARDITVKLIAFSPVSGFVRLICSLEEAIKLGVEWVAGTTSATPATDTKSNPRAGTIRAIGKVPLITTPPSPAPVVVTARRPRR